MIHTEQPNKETTAQTLPACPEHPNFKQTCILDAAADIFFRDGFEGASVDEIAAEGNISKRTIYNYFPDKRSLFLAVISYKLNPEMAAQSLDPSQLRGPATVREDLVRVASRIIDAELDPETAAIKRVLVTDVIRMPELTGACEKLRPSAAINTLAARLAELFPDHLTEEQAATAVNQLIGVAGAQVQARSAFWSLPVPQEMRDQVATETVDLIVRAYRLED